jgi:5-methylcytosine-specific restriction endonuclease McrA
MKRTAPKARTPLKRKAGLESRKPLKPMSKKQRTKNRLWKGIADGRAEEENFTCQWCHRRGQRTDPQRLDYLDGHHIIKRRYNIHMRENCYICHRFKCHGEIEDNNVDVGLFPNREAWIKGKERKHGDL